MQQLLLWLGGERGTLPPLNSRSSADDGLVVYEGDALPYFLRELPEFSVVDAFAADNRAAIETHSVPGISAEEQRTIWLARVEGGVLCELVVTKGGLSGTRKNRERYSTPPPGSREYLSILGFRPAEGFDDGLPDGERLTDGRLVVSLRPAIGQSGWVKVDNRIHVIGSYAPFGAQIWAIQRGVPFGGSRSDRLADLEVVEVRDKTRSSQVLSSISESHVIANSGLVLKGVDVAWHVYGVRIRS